MKKYRFKFFVFGISSIVIFSCFIWSIFYEPVNNDPNVYYFDGKITKIIQSNVHDFSVYEIELDTAYIHIIDSSFYLQSKTHFPMFRYKGNLGEVYKTYSYEDSVGYRIKSDTLRKSIVILDNKGEIVNTTPMFPIEGPYRIEVIRKNSKIK